MRNYFCFITLVFAIALFCSGCVSDKVETGQHAHAFKKKIDLTIKSDYLLYLPETYNSSQKKWPLILFLHGAGERGNDLDQVKRHGPPKLIAKGKKDLPFIIVSPQCPKNGWWANNIQMKALNLLLDEIISKYRVDKDRIYLTGLSMGGYGTWSLAAENPERFAAIAPICGGGDPHTAKKLAKMPIWVFHGGKDKVVPIDKSQKMVEALKKAGNEVKFTVYPEAGHNSWAKTYDNPELYKWFLDHSRPFKP